MPSDEASRIIVSNIPGTARRKLGSMRLIEPATVELNETGERAIASRASAHSPRLSERESSAELEDSAAVGCTGNSARSARTDRGSGIAEVGVIKGIDGIYTELELVPLRP